MLYSAVIFYYLHQLNTKKICWFMYTVHCTVCWNSSPTIFLFIIIPNQGKERPAKTNCMPGKLCAVLVRVESDSAWCQSARKPTPHCVSRRGVRLRIVLVGAESAHRLYLSHWIFRKCTFLTPCCGTQRQHGVWLHTGLASAESDTTQCYTARVLTYFFQLLAD